MSIKMIRLVKKEDLEHLAIIYKDLYDNVDIGEDWSVEKSLDLLNYWYSKQSDLFFVAEEDGNPVGAIMSGVKPWFDGLRLVDTELFVSESYQGRHIGRMLIFEHLKEAKIKYNVMKIEFHTYGDELEFPQNWYSRIWLRKSEELIIMDWNVETILKTLGFKVDDVVIGKWGEGIINYWYSDLIGLYSSLWLWDIAYIFDMLPEYAYINTDYELKYVESRITAMKNGANIFLFLVGDEKRINNLRSNELYNYTINSCYWNSKVMVVNDGVLKQKCPNEFFQLAQWLYFGMRAEGSKEAFRDLWIDSNNMGILIKDNSILNYIEKSVFRIMDVINGDY